MWKVRFCFSRVARRFTMRPRRPRAVSAGKRGVPAVRRGRSGGGRVAPRLPGHGHHGGQALVLLQVVTSLSVYISCLFFGGLRGDGVDRGVVSRLEPPPVREARRRPEPLEPPAAGANGSSLPGVTMNAHTRAELHGSRRGQSRWQLQLASRRGGACPSMPALPQAKTAPHVSTGSLTPAIRRWRAQSDGPYSGTLKGW